LEQQKVTIVIGDIVKEEVEDLPVSNEEDGHAGSENFLPVTDQEETAPDSDPKVNGQAVTEKIPLNSDQKENDQVVLDSLPTHFTTNEDHAAMQDDEVATEINPDGLENIHTDADQKEDDQHTLEEDSEALEDDLNALEGGQDSLVSDPNVLEDPLSDPDVEVKNPADIENNFSEVDLQKDKKDDIAIASLAVK